MDNTMAKTLTTLEAETYTIGFIRDYDVTLLHDKDDVDHFNNEYGLNYNYYFVFWIDDCTEGD